MEPIFFTNQSYDKEGNIYVSFHRGGEQILHKTGRLVGTDDDK